MMPGTIFSALFYWMIGVSEISKSGSTFLLAPSLPKTECQPFPLGLSLSKHSKDVKSPSTSKTPLLWLTSTRRTTNHTISNYPFYTKLPKCRSINNLSRPTTSICTGVVPNNWPITRWLDAICKLEICWDQALSVVLKSINMVVCSSWTGEARTTLPFLEVRPESLPWMVTPST